MSGRNDRSRGPGGANANGKGGPGGAGAETLRRAADGELTRDDSEAFERSLHERPEDRARVEFERSLRAGVGRVMGAERAPRGLRERIVASLRAGSQTSGRPRSVLRRYAFVPVAAAAALLLTSAAMFLLPEGPPPPAPAGQPWRADFGARLVGFVEREHNSCAAFGAHQRGKMKFKDPAAAEAALRRLVGAAPKAIVLEDIGYTFVGLGPCAVPGGAPSAHMIYRSSDGQGPALSVFVQRDDGQVNVEFGRRLAAGCTDACPDRVYIWREGGLVHYLVTADVARAPAACIALGGPEAETRI